MSNFVPIVVDSEEIILLALELRAAKEHMSPTRLVNAILRSGLQAEIEEVSNAPPRPMGGGEWVAVRPLSP